MCSSAHYPEIQGIEAIMKMTRIDERQKSIANELTYSSLPSCLVNIESKEPELKDLKTTSVFVDRPLIIQEKNSSTKRVRDIDGYRQRAAALFIRRAESVISNKSNFIVFTY